MTEQPVETEQQFLGNVSTVPPVFQPAQPAVLTTNRPQAYLPNGHRLRPPFKSVLLQDIDEGRREKIVAELNAAAQDTIAQLRDVSARLQPSPPVTEQPASDTDLWLDAEETATRAIHEIQDGNVNAGIAYLQAALAFALNYRQSLSEETTR
jgi:hypothetical protein